MTMRFRAIGFAIAGGLIVLLIRLGVSAQQVDTCQRLAAFTLPHGTITSAARVEAGAFSPPSGRRGSTATFADLRAFCRITTTTPIPPSSEAKSEIWLPIDGWNRELQPAGGGFYGGGMPYARMREILRTGAATAGSDSAIQDGAQNLALAHPEQLNNLANLPFHAMIEQAKTLVARFFGGAPRVTFMDECGGGGSRDVLAVVQRWPSDLDAAVAIGSTNHGTHHGIAQMWMYWATHKDEASYIPVEKYPMIHEAALEACDLKDGVKDGVIEDPPHCAFDPAVLTCKGADGPNCLTAPQVAAVRRIYETPRHARTGQALYGPMVPGSELSWEDMTAKPRPYPYAETFYRFFVARDPNWDYKTFRPDFAADVDRADAPQNLPMNATNPNISAFVDHGGKLLMMGGWNDDLGPGNNVTYYEDVVRTIGAAKARNSVRLFMVPGMHHCLGLDYPSTYKVDFDLPGAVKRWKATGKAPDDIVVSTTRKGQALRRRLVCAYPKVSQYKGNGSVDDPSNFSCTTP
jgi:feruloyl esterase